MAVAVLIAVSSCSSADSQHGTEAQGARPSGGAGRADPRTPTAHDLSTVPLTAAEVTGPRARATATHVNATEDARVRTLLTWCTRTASREDGARTVYGPRILVEGPHGENAVYSYARALPAGTGRDATAYAAHLVTCWRTVLVPVLAAALDADLTTAARGASTRPLPLKQPAYGTAHAVESVVAWHPAAGTTSRAVFDAAVVFGAHTEVTVLAMGADGLTTGSRHLSADVAAVAARIRAAEHPEVRRGS